MLDHLDRGVGSMVDLLEQLEILDNTIIFFAGDNGYSHWGTSVDLYIRMIPLFKNKGPGRKGKFASTHEGGVRVPFFVYWKDKIKAGENDHIQLYDLYDVLATVADLAGVISGRKQTASVLHRHCSLDQTSSKLTNTCTGKTECVRNTHNSVRMNQWWAYREHPPGR